MVAAAVRGLVAVCRPQNQDYGRLCGDLRPDQPGAVCSAARSVLSDHVLQSGWHDGIGTGSDAVHHLESEIAGARFPKLDSGGGPAIAASISAGRESAAPAWRAGTSLPRQ